MKRTQKFKENIAKTLPASFWPSCVMIFLPVLHGNDWIVYCAHRYTNVVSFREQERCAAARQDQRKSVMKVLQQAKRKKFPLQEGQK